jgi:hypothetical protein
LSLHHRGRENHFPPYNLFNAASNKSFFAPLHVEEQALTICGLTLGGLGKVFGLT